MAKFKNNRWTALPLSTDHKPDDKREMQRILSKGGRVEAYQGNSGLLSANNSCIITNNRSEWRSCGSCARLVKKQQHSRVGYGEVIWRHRCWVSRGDRRTRYENSEGICDNVWHLVEIMEWKIQEEDKFMVIASDGVWEFLSNEQVMNYVLPFYLKQQLDAACDKLVYESTIRWREV